jgi:hypothetical protein
MGRSTHLVAELARKSPVTFVDLGFHAWGELELFSDAIDAHCGLVVHPARPHSPPPQRAWLIAEDPTR